MVQIDLLIYNARQLLTCASPNGPKRGTAMQNVGLIEEGAVAIDQGKIIEVGLSSELMTRYTAKTMIDAHGKVVCPGFVDPHTHVVYAGDRVNEFEMRIKGATYMEIMEAGGGIVSSARAVRAASIDQLVDETLPRLDTMLSFGTTTLEVKTGYGLDEDSELKLLKAIETLAKRHPCTLVPTFLGAHAIPQEYKSKPERYVRIVIEKMLPHAAAWYEESLFKQQDIPFYCDVFCEQNAFTLDQSRRILEAGLLLGLGAKIHADEFTSLGGVRLAVELNAVSVDHLDVTTAVERDLLANSNTIGVVLPAVNFNLGSAHFADARSLLDSGCAIALSTDINPGSAPCPSLPLVMAIAARYQHLMPSEVLIASTINAAYAIGMGKRVGSLEPGKFADVLILSTGDYRNLCYQFADNLVETVIKNGEIITS
jgi:imidazolonepropionase